MPDDRYDRVTFRGRTVDKYSRASLLAVEKELGYELTIVQGSYNKGKVAASAGTHDGGGCIDLLAWDAPRKVASLRRNGWVADKRLKSQGFTGDHIHAVQIGNTKASAAAKAQIAPMERGEAGLARRVPQVIKYTPPGGYKAFTYPAPTPVPPKEPTVPSPLVFNFLGLNVYASQYTGGKFSAKRQAALKAVFKDGSASLLALSEINLAYDHNTIVSLLGAQFNHADTYVRANGNNHLYPDANKWKKTGAKEVDLLGVRQFRRVTLATYKHKASGQIISVWAAHFSSAAGFRAAGMSSTAASKQAAADQVAEAKALARILAGKPLPDWDVDLSIGYVDSNMVNAGRPYLDGKGTTSVYDLVKVGNSEYGSLHTLGKPAAKDGKHIDDVRVGKRIKVRKARQILNWDASDHLALSVQGEVVDS